MVIFALHCFTAREKAPVYSHVHWYKYHSLNAFTLGTMYSESHSQTLERNIMILFTLFSLGICF